jgi:hypothetical protein
MGRKIWNEERYDEKGTHGFCVGMNGNALTGNDDAGDGRAHNGSHVEGTVDGQVEGGLGRAILIGPLGQPDAGESLKRKRRGMVNSLIKFQLQ